MSSAFTTQLRTRRAAIILAEPGEGVITFRVEMAELWDAIRVSAPTSAVVSEVKERVVAAAFGADAYAHEFVLKLRGWEILDENGTLAECGIAEGSILLLGYRRRRPVR